MQAREWELRSRYKRDDPPRVDRSPDTGVNGYKQFNGWTSWSLRVIVIIRYAAVVIKIGVT